MTNNFIKLTQKDMEKYDIINKLICKQIIESEAAKMIWLSIRQIRRIKKRVIEWWVEWIIHKSRWSPSNRKFSNEFNDSIISIVKDKYYDFKPTFASEKLLQNHSIKISKETLRNLMIKHKLWNPKTRKLPNNHYWRARKDNYWEMQQFDWSYHKWLEERNWWKEICLIASIDDATWEITEAKFDINEWTVAVNNFWIDYFNKNWLPLSIYLDKFSTYKINNPWACDNKDLMTQFQRSMNQVWVKLITAHSPQAKGRIERLFETLQDRLVKDMRLDNISSIDEANEYLKKYIPKYNKQFWKLPKNKTNLHKPLNWLLKDNLNQIFSIQTSRKINNDMTISYHGNIYLLEKNQLIWVYKKEIVTIEEYLNWEIKINYKNYYLNFSKVIEKPNNNKYIPISKDMWWSKNKPAHNHPWRRAIYSSKPETYSLALERRKKFETLRLNNQLNLDINKIVMK